MSASIIAIKPQPSLEGSVNADALEQRASTLARRYDQARPQDILNAAINEEFKGRIALVSSFGAESAVLLHLAASIDPTIPVIFLDTGKHFAQTLSYRRKLALKLGLNNVLDIHPDTDELMEKDSAGDLWRNDADACCTLRKVKPLKSVLSGFDAWITGRKQFHGGQRIHLPVFDSAPPHIKVNPLVRWMPSDIADYTAANDIQPHPLVAQGYPSIGCWPCTHPVAEGGDVRDGRWRGSAKTECGIHQDPAQ